MRPALAAMRGIAPWAGCTDAWWDAETSRVVAFARPPGLRAGDASVLLSWDPAAGSVDIDAPGSPAWMATAWRALLDGAAWYPMASMATRAIVAWVRAGGSTATALGLLQALADRDLAGWLLALAGVPDDEAGRAMLEAARRAVAEEDGDE